MVHSLIDLGLGPDGLLFERVLAGDKGLETSLEVVLGGLDSLLLPLQELRVLAQSALPFDQSFGFLCQCTLLSTDVGFRSLKLLLAVCQRIELKINPGLGFCNGGLPGDTTFITPVA